MKKISVVILTVLIVSVLLVGCTTNSSIELPPEQPDQSDEERYLEGLDMAVDNIIPNLNFVNLEAYDSLGERTISGVVVNESDYVLTFVMFDYLNKETNDMFDFTCTSNLSSGDVSENIKAYFNSDIGIEDIEIKGVLVRFIDKNGDEIEIYYDYGTDLYKYYGR